MKPVEARASRSVSTDEQAKGGVARRAGGSAARRRDLMVKYYTPKEVARELRVTERTVYEWLTTGRLRGMRAGTRWRIRPEDLEAFMQAKHGGATVAPRRAADSDAEDHARRVDALMGKYAHAGFTTDELFRERREDYTHEERRVKP